MTVPWVKNRSPISSVFQFQFANLPNNQSRQKIKTAIKDSQEAFEIFLKDFINCNESTKENICLCIWVSLWGCQSSFTREEDVPHKISLVLPKSIVLHFSCVYLGNSFSFLLVTSLCTRAGNITKCPTGMLETLNYVCALDL